MDYIDTNGNTQFLDFETKNKKIYSLLNVDNVYKILNFSNEIKILTIENNKNLKTILKFPKSLDILIIINNQTLEYIHLPNVRTSIKIFGNPMLNDIEKQIKEYKKTKYYTFCCTTIITNDENDNEPDIEIGTDIDKDLLHIDEWNFTTNVDEYKKSPTFLHNNNDFFISYIEYNGYEYPIITLPKGTILYNYDRGNNINIKDKYYKLYNLEQDYELEKQLKFFYPLPYAAFMGIETNYNYCNIVVTNNDIKILCLLSPAPQSNETLRLQPKNKVINNNLYGVNYYDNNLTFKCDIYEHDLCINLNMMKEMNLQGYISIAEKDSISNGEVWRKNISNEHFAEFIKEYLFKSCFSSIYQKNNNVDYINQCLDTKLPNYLKNRLFGVPEIALVPLNSKYFFDLDIQQHIFDNFNNTHDFNELNNSNINQLFYNYFNYSIIDICNLTELKKSLERIECNIITNKQSQIFQLFSVGVINNSSKITSIEKIKFDDVDYISSYKNENKTNPFCCFETIGYHLLNNNKITGKKYKTLKFLKKNKKTRYKYDNIKIKIINKNNSIQKAGNNNYKLILERTKRGIPIMYFANE